MTEPELKTVYWTVTNECNERCKYCWIDAGTRRGRELTTEEWLGVFRRIVDMGLETVKITGGEPTLHWQKIKVILKFLMDHEIHLRMETNGTLICDKNNEDILEILKNRFFALVSVSLDSHIPLRHDEFRGMKGAFKKTVKALNFLKENQIPFSIITVLQGKNYKQILDTIEFVETLAPQYHQMNILMPEGRTKMHSEYQVSADFYIHELPSFIKKIKKKRKNRVKFNVPFIFDPYDRDYGTCSVGKKICGLLPNGDIAVCGAGINRRELSLGNVLHDDICDVWVNSPAFLALRKDVFLSKGICGNCVFAKYCRGYCRAHSFSVYSTLDAPFPICQMLYEQGVFPEKYMINPTRGCYLELQ